MRAIPCGWAWECQIMGQGICAPTQNSSVHMSKARKRSAQADTARGSVALPPCSLMQPARPLSSDEHSRCVKRALRRAKGGEGGMRSSKRGGRRADDDREVRAARRNGLGKGRGVSEGQGIRVVAAKRAQGGNCDAARCCNHPTRPSPSSRIQQPVPHRQRVEGRQKACPLCGREPGTYSFIMQRLWSNSFSVQWLALRCDGFSAWHRDTERRS